LTEWQFSENEVLENEDGEWWHVIHRLESVDGPASFYVLEDATHTEQKQLHREDVEGERGMFESCGWETNTKPAAEQGYIVNGVLCGKANVDYWRGNKCLHDKECGECGADGKGEIDIIRDIEGGQAQSIQCICRECGHQWSDSDE
jgi:hypothetical protein